MTINFIQPIKKIWRESVWSWAFRLAVSVCGPLVVGYFNGNLSDMFWTALAAQSLALIELRGNFASVIRVLLLGSILSIGTCVLGSVTGHIVWVHVVMMFFVGFVSTLFKNLGERGVGMALSFYVLYILSSSMPTLDVDAVMHRVKLVGEGQIWAIVLAALWMLVEKQGRPLRRTLADVFFEMSVLTQKARSGFGGEGLFVTWRELFQQESQVRHALNISIELFGSSDKENYSREMAEQIRKIAGLLNIELLDIIDQSRALMPYRKIDQADVHLHTILRIWEQIFKLSHDYIAHLKLEDRILLQTRFERLADISKAIEEQEYTDEMVQKLLFRILHLSNRMARLAGRIVDILDKAPEKRTFQVYSFTRTLSILHPKLFGNELTNFFRFERNTTLYALRVGIGVTAGALIDHLFFTHHGYWIPLTTIIVAQPYISATFKRGIERVIGTLVGVLVGYFLFDFIRIPELSIALVFISTVLSIYFLKKKYIWATFFVTLSLIGLLSVARSGGEEILEVRFLATLLGAVISMATGFLFLSSWDAEMIYEHFKNAIKSNYEYWLSCRPLGEHQRASSWLRYKRMAESANATLYESFSRWQVEPEFSKDRKEIGRFYARIAHLIRITKEINNINIEWEMQQMDDADIQTVDIQPINELFEQIMQLQGISYEDNQLDTSSEVQLSYSQRVALEKLLLELRALKLSLEQIKGMSAR